MAARHRLDARLGASAVRSSKSNPVIRRHSAPAAAPSQQQVVAAMRMAMLQRKWGSLELDQGSNAQCHVCRSGFKDGQMTIDLPCRHTFHSKCIIPWLHNHTYCPACKASISIA
ncbi:hypothetical protein KP509_09G062700 [Ceratopteris richardii]|nr:hypothetical protein KP509_09G062700 [Ceratopteris richardii]